MASLLFLIYTPASFSAQSSDITLDDPLPFIREWYREQQAIFPGVQEEAEVEVELEEEVVDGGDQMEEETFETEGTVRKVLFI